MALYGAAARIENCKQFPTDMSHDSLLAMPSVSHIAIVYLLVSHVDPIRVPHPTHRCLLPDVPPHHQAPPISSPLPSVPPHNMSHLGVPPHPSKKHQAQSYLHSLCASVLVKPCWASNLSIHHVSCPVGKEPRAKMLCSEIRKKKHPDTPIRNIVRSHMKPNRLGAVSSPTGDFFLFAMSLLRAEPGTP